MLTALLNTNKDPLMKTKHFIILGGFILLIAGGLFVIYLSTETLPYKEYSPVFQQRGDVLTEDRFPKNASDSLFAVQMEIAQYKDEIRNELNKNKINWGGVIAGGTAIITSFLGILGAFFSRMDRRRANDIDEVKFKIDKTHFETEKKVTENHEVVLQRLDENSKEHASIFKTLEIVEDFTIRRDIKESFRSISRNYMHYQKGSIPDELQVLISSQSERLIEMSDQIMNEKFTKDVYELSLLKLDEQCKIAWQQVTELFGIEFLTYYKCAQGKAVKAFKNKLKSIATDHEFNGKYERYKRAGEAFLDDIIPLTIEEYRKFQKQKK